MFGVLLFRWLKVNATDSNSRLGVFCNRELYDLKSSASAQEVLDQCCPDIASKCFVNR